MKKSFSLITVLLLSALAFAGCSRQESTQESAAVHSAAPSASQIQGVEKTVSLEFSQKRTPKGVEVSVYLENPEKEAISSVRAWLAFNPQHVQGLNLYTKDSDFPLPAPGENQIDNERGLVKIARGAEGSVNSKRLLVAKVVLKPLKDGISMVEAYSYQPEGNDGYVSANIVVNGTPYNVLKAPTVPAFVIKNKLNR